MQNLIFILIDSKVSFPLQLSVQMIKSTEISNKTWQIHNPAGGNGDLAELRTASELNLVLVERRQRESEQHHTLCSQTNVNNEKKLGNIAHRRGKGREGGKGTWVETELALVEHGGGWSRGEAQAYPTRSARTEVAVGIEPPAERSLSSSARILVY